MSDLNIKITAEAKQAQQALSSLASHFDTLNTKLNNINSSGLSGFTDQIKNFRQQANALGKIKISMPKIDNRSLGAFRNSINSLSQIDLTAIQGMQSELSGVASALSVFNGLDPNSATNIRAFANALRSLGKVDLSNLNSSDFTGVANGLSSFSSIPDISRNISSFTSSLARLSSSGANISTVASQLPTLSNALNSSIQSLQNVGDVSDSVNSLVSSISRLASAGSKTGETATGIQDLTREVLQFFNSMQNAPRINDNTLRMTEALARLASAGGRVGTATNTVSSAMNQLSSISNKASNVVKSACGKIVNAFKGIASSHKHINNASFSLANLLKVSLGYKATNGLASFARTTIELGSSISELENVVETAFGSMKNHAYAFAETATENFGLSKIAAMQYSGTLMAMLKASGLGLESAAQVSTTLTGLAGDFASFYNVSSEETFRAFRSGLSGEIEPLRRYGINLSVANLEAYALANGITKSYQAMSEAEKVMLRYNYIMANTNDQRGDFVKTSDNFANQLRVLNMNFQQLSATIGQAFTVILTPVIQVLNAIIGKLTQAAEAFRTFVYTLFGKKYESSGRGIVSEVSGIEDMADSVSGIGSAGNDASTGLDNATSSAQDLKKALTVLPFDELNQLSSNETPSSSGGGSGSGGVGGLGDIGSALSGLEDLSTGLEDAFGTEDTVFDRWARQVRHAFLSEDWERLGLVVARGINIGLEKLYDILDWNKVGKKITKFTDAFTRTFNSLVDNINWNLLGRTFGTGINTFVNTAHQIISGINWLNLGTEFARGFNGLFAEIKWKSLGRTIGEKFMIGWDVFRGFVHELNFSEIGRSIAKGLSGIVAEFSLSDVADGLVTAMNGAFDTLASFTRTFEWNTLVDNIVGGINTFITNFEWEENGATLNNFIQNLLNALVDITAGADFQGLVSGIGNALDKVNWLAIGDKLKTILGNIFFPVIEGLANSTTGKVVIALSSLKLIVASTSLINGIVTLTNNLRGLSGSLTGLPGRITTLTTNIGALGKILPIAGGALTGFLIGMKLTEEEVGDGSDFEDASVYVSAYGSVLQQLANTEVITAEKQAELNAKMWDAQNSFNSPVEAISAITQMLSEAGVTSTQLGTALDTLGIDLSELTNAMKNNEESAALQAEKLAQMAATANALDFGDLKTKLASLDTETEKIDFATLILNTSNAIDKMGGLWSDGKQILGEKALEVYAEILRGLSSGELEADSNGFYTLANGQMVAYGNGLTDKVGETQTTITEDLAEMITGVEMDTSELWLNSGSMHVAKYINGILDKKDEVKTNALSVFTPDISSEIKKDGQQDGKNLVDGWLLGINSNKANAKTAITNFANNDIKSPFQTAMDIHSPSGVFESFGENTIQGLVKGINNKSELAKTTISDLGKDLSSSMSGYLDTIRDGADTLTTDLSNKFSSIQNSVSNIVSTIVNAFRNIYIPLPHITINWSRVGFGSANIPVPTFGINWYAKGGLFDGASVIGVGEAGKEAVLPLENRKTMSTIADSIVSRMNGNSFNAKAIEEAVERGIVMAMMNNQANQRPIIVNAELKTENNEVLARAVARGQQEIDYRNNSFA